MGRYAGINVQFQASLALCTRINYKVLRKPTVKQKEFSAEAQEKGSSKLILKDWQELWKAVSVRASRCTEWTGNAWSAWGPETAPETGRRCPIHQVESLGLEL